MFFPRFNKRRRKWRMDKDPKAPKCTWKRKLPWWDVICFFSKFCPKKNALQYSWHEQSKLPLFYHQNLQIFTCSDHLGGAHTGAMVSLGGFFRAQMELAPTGSWWIYEPVDGSEIGPKKTPPFGDAFWNRSDVVGSYFTSTLKPLAFNRAENLQEWLSSLQLPTAEVVSWWGVKVGKGWANKVCGGCGGWDLFCQPWIFILSINLWVISSNIKDPNQKIL